MKQINPTHSRMTAASTGRDTLTGWILLASRGEPSTTTATPMRAMAISTPMASAISLPLNHFTMPRDTVMPAISTPQPKSMKPMADSLAEAGMPS